MFGETFDPSAFGLKPGATFGESQAALGNLRKALEVGTTFPAGPGMNAAQLMAAVPQDLSHLVVRTSFENQHLVLWRKLQANKGKARSTVHQFLRTGQYGGDGDNIFFGEGGLPAESSAQRELASLPMAYAGTVRRVTLQSTLVDTVLGDVVQDENRNGTLAICQGLEKSLFFGDRAINPFAFDGIKKQIEAEGETVVLDARGQALTEDMIVQAMTRATSAPNYGAISHIYGSPQLYASMQRIYFARMRQQLGQSIQPNYVLDSMTFPSGKVQIEQDVFLQNEGHDLRGAAGDDASKRPLPPIIDVQPAAAANPNSKFVGADAGNYIYFAQAISPTGRSNYVELNPVALGAGEGATFTLRDAGVGSQRATGFLIYRSEKGGAASTAKHMVTVPRTAELTQVVDLNATVPGTQTLFLLSMNPTYLQWVDFLPFFNFPLANIDTSYRWALLQFGALKVGAPRKHFLIKNIKPDFMAGVAAF